MKKIWYLDLNGHLEGPYTLYELRKDKRITPDTLVWKEGFAHSVPMRNVPELKAVFADEEPKKENVKDKSNRGMGAKQLNDMMIMDMSQEPPFLMWLIVIFTLFILAWYLHTQ